MRRSLDSYQTPNWQTDVLLDYVPEIARFGGTILCPTAGDLSIVNQIEKRFPFLFSFITNDIDPNSPTEMHRDATTPAFWAQFDPSVGGTIRIDWVIDNLPFVCAPEILAQALPVARIGVAALARISLVEPTKGKKGRPGRGQWMRANPRQKQIVMERHSYTEDGHSDSATTEWLVWSQFVKERGCYSAFGYKPRTGGEDGV